MLDADLGELDFLGWIPDGEHDEFDPARILDVKTGAEAHDSLTALVEAGHTLVWHRWQKRLARKVWGVTVRILPLKAGRAPMDSAMHFGIKVRASQKFALRIDRDEYARINKTSSLPRWPRDANPELWDSVDGNYEDSNHRIYTDEWCAENQARALENYDLNMAHFAALDPGEFEAALQHTVNSRRGMTEVTDLTKWDGVQGLYIMVLDDHRQVYIGATDHPHGIMARIRQHWAGGSSSTGSSGGPSKHRSCRSTASARWTRLASSPRRPTTRSVARTSSWRQCPPSSP